MISMRRRLSGRDSRGSIAPAVDERVGDELGSDELCVFERRGEIIAQMLLQQAPSPRAAAVVYG